jgi:hypothetical protein
MSQNKVNFNFNAATEKNFEITPKIIEKKLSLVSHSFKAHPRVWLSVGLLICCLFGITLWTFQVLEANKIKVRLLNDKIIQLEKPNLAKNIFTGHQFTLQFDKIPPSGFFGKNEKYTNLGYFPTKIGQSTKYIYKNQKLNQDFLTGIEVISAEADAKFSFVEFKNKFASDTKYRETNEIFKIKNNTELTKFVNDSSQIVYYLGKTGQNYYVVKIYNQNQDQSSLSDKTEFVDSILDYLYLN